MILEQSVFSEEECCPASGKRPSGEIWGLERTTSGNCSKRNFTTKTKIQKYLKKRAVLLLLRLDSMCQIK